MLKYLYISFAVIVTSFYLFPFTFNFFPIANTKLCMAVLGIPLLALYLLRNKISTISRNFINISALALAVSLVGCLSLAYNSTTDFTYASYIFSMMVWMSAAFVVVITIYSVHGHVDFLLLSNYLIAVCSVQCILAIAIDSYMPLKHFVDGFVQGEGFMGVSKDRLYGIGASLDVAGTRFASVLLIITSVLLVGNIDKNSIKWYFISYIIIFVVGNMIARTTTVGAVLSILFFLVYKRKSASENMLRIWNWGVGIFLVGIFAGIYFYHTNPSFNQNLRFAFEGFFSLVETGSWEVHSNDKLMTMIVFPDNLKTWIIGDGYFDGPLFSNPDYIGKGIGSYYMNTDIGYLRFIFYFGMIGLIVFSIFMFKCTSVSIQYFTDRKYLFSFLCLLNFTIWFKVATDIFLVFALYLALGFFMASQRDQQNRIG